MTERRTTHLPDELTLVTAIGSPFLPMSLCGRSLLEKRYVRENPTCKMCQKIAGRTAEGETTI